MCERLQGLGEKVHGQANPNSSHHYLPFVLINIASMGDWWSFTLICTQSLHRALSGWLWSADKAPTCANDQRTANRSTVAKDLKLAKREVASSYVFTPRWILCDFGPHNCCFCWWEHDKCIKPHHYAKTLTQLGDYIEGGYFMSHCQELVHLVILLDEPCH